MSEIVLLRNMTRESVINWNCYNYGYKVKDMLARGTKGKLWLVWTYYNRPKINFTQDILDEIKIGKSRIIHKPGKPTGEIARKFYIEIKKILYSEINRKEIEGQKTIEKSFEKQRKFNGSWVARTLETSKEINKTINTKSYGGYKTKLQLPGSMK